jgi:hypothetical protein
MPLIEGGELMKGQAKEYVGEFFVYHTVLQAFTNKIIYQIHVLFLYRLSNHTLLGESFFIGCSRKISMLWHAWRIGAVSIP